MDAKSYRDLNKNGRLDPYEDRRRPIEERVEDLLSQMTLEEKAGLMFHTMIGMSRTAAWTEHGRPVHHCPTAVRDGGRR